jgi:hypothetical protein
METIIIQCPHIPMKFDRNLLSTPIWRYDAEKIHQLSAMLLKNILGAEFKRFPSTIKKLQQQQQQFMELYERAKTKEREGEEEKTNKTHTPFYRTRLASKADRAIHERLEREKHLLDANRKPRKNHEI